MSEARPAAPALSPLAGRVGEEIGVSPWIEVTQARIDRFAEATGDFQFIHVDPERARSETAFGGTIAHGFLSLSLLSAASNAALPPRPAGAVGINYGFDKVRFLAPVPAGGRVRGRFRLAAFTPRGPNEYVTRFDVTLELEGSERPALVAEWLTMTVLKG